MNHIEDLWDEYRNDAVFEDMSYFEVRGRRLAFFTGAFCLFSEIKNKLQDPNVSASDGEKFLDEILAEYKNFCDRLEKFPG